MKETKHNKIVNTIIIDCILHMRDCKLRRIKNKLKRNRKQTRIHSTISAIYTRIEYF